jgi:hypothetical protein
MPLTADQAPPAQAAGSHILVSGADVNNVIPIDTAGTSPHRVILLQEARGVPVDAHMDLWTVMTPDGARLDLNRDSRSRHERAKPELLELSQFGPNDTSVQVSPLGKVSVIDENGGPAPDNIILQPYETKPFRLRLSNPLPAGQFRARIQVRTADAGVAQSTIDVRLRHNWIWAFLVIIMGALASFMLRAWIESGRARAVQDQKLQEQLRQIPAGKWPGSRLNQLLISQLEAARTSLQLGQAVDVDAKCALVQELLPRIDEISQHLDEVGLNDLEKDFVDRQVSDARDRLLALFNTPTPRPQDKTDADDALKQVLAAIDHAHDAGKLQQQIAMAHQLANDPLLAPNQKLMIAHAAAAQDALAAGDLNKAQSEISLALAPNGLCDDLCKQLEAIVTGWSNTLSTLNAAAAAGADPSQDAARAALAQLDTNIQVLRTSPATDVENVLLDYNSVLVQMATTVTALPDAVRTAMKSDAKLALPQQWSPASQKPATGIAHRFAAVAQRTGSQRRHFGWFSISLKDDGVSIISIIVSALVGLQLLWVANATFGGLNDYITALVWGFGLHQLNETVRQAGPAAITSVLRNPKSS